METLPDFARRVLFETCLDEKLRPAKLPLADDDAPGESIDAPVEPGRPPELEFGSPRSAPAMPKFAGFNSPERRGLAHHIMANHELQALEIMAATLLRYPAAPCEFRQGMARIMLDEQRHTRMHMARAEKLGVPFGSVPVNAYIWAKARDFEDVLDYLAGLPLVFEGANLDHSLEFAEAFSVAGDERSAHVMRQIHEDEIEHVAFGIKWLRHFKPADQSDWDAFVTHLKYPLRAEKARGDHFQEQARREAGLDDEFIRNLLELRPFPTRYSQPVPTSSSGKASHG